MPATPRVNALQKLWLREIGIEKTWLPAGPVAAAAAPSPEARGAAEPESAPRPAAAPAPVPRPAVAAAAAPGPAAAPPAAAPTRPAARPAAVAKPPAPAPADAPVPATVPVPAHDLEAMREQVVQCTACGLCNGRRHAVFGMGARPARWMVVGEAPGEQEDRQGLPFVGRSGQLLDAMLASVGMSREKDVFIANVIKCRPPGNRNPKPEEIAACSPYLMRQIELLKPERILVLGRFAAQTLLGTDATIGSLRGRRHTLAAPDGREIPVVVSYHPAYLLRSPGEKARAWQDLRLAAALG
ncbi:uracil-DNA glycosylase family protein [Bordetella petrii]|uniref:uracil-DNA glycosylase n=1 Tax=Bordetella petrii TaxID=94624 RepID=UPI0038B2CAE1